MTRSYRRSRRSRSSRATRGIVSSFFLIALGTAGFYGAMNWFRSGAADSLAATEESVVAQDSQEAAKMVAPANAVPLTTTSPLVSAYDGQHTGKIDRILKTGSAEFYLVAYLPPVNGQSDEYRVWLLKNGLADVRDMGALTPRADGSWVLNFTASPITGIADPDKYTTAVIMREPVDGNPAPSGNRIAEAKF